MKKRSCFTLCIIACLSFLLWVGFRVYNNIQFDRHCEGYLKQAADANTVDLAKKQLTIAVSYCENNGLTSGYTSILYTTPDEDIGFWYTNLRKSLSELDSVSDSATQLEKSNVLMKLRETLLDDTSDGTEVTSPAGISIYPGNTAYMLWCVISLVLFVLFGICGIIADE